MGTGSGGSAVAMLRGGNRFKDNITDLRSNFPATAKGYFGKRGQGRKHTRNIESNNPARTAAEFAGLASKNPVGVVSIEGKGLVYRIRDGSIITHRFTSSSKDKSPVVELKIKNASGVKSQKIHFTKKGR